MVQYLSYHHTPFLVLFSVATTMITCYAAVELALTLKSPHILHKKWWLALGSLGLGIGIWSMYFAGMLALKISNLEIQFDAYWILASILFSVFATVLSLHVVSKKTLNLKRILLASICIEWGIVTMHFSGMASVILPLNIIQNSTFVSLGIVFSSLCSLITVYLFSQIDPNKERQDNFYLRILTSLFLSSSFVIMHYLGKLGLSFKLIGDTQAHHYAISVDNLSVVVTVISFFIILATILGAELEKYLFRKELVSRELLSMIEKKDDFVLMVTQELLSPVTILKLQFQIIVKDLRSNQYNANKILSMLRKSDQSLNKMNGMINDLMDAIRLNQSGLQLSGDNVHLDQIIKNALQYVEESTQFNNITFLLKGSSVSSPRWDQRRLEQVFINLFINSLKNSLETQIEVDISSSGNDVSISIKDTFLNSSRQAEHVLQGHSYEIPLSQIGFDFYMAQSIVDLHHGKLEIVKDNPGSPHFLITLPI